MQSLLDLIELSKMEKEQLIQLCEALYALLQARDVNVNVQPAPAPISWPTNIPPYNPVPINPAINPQITWGDVPCTKFEGQETWERPQQ